MQYCASLITADGAYHCPVGSTWPFFSQQQAAWILFLVLSVHKNIISYQKTVACTFVQVTAGSQAKIDLAIKLGADKGVIVIIIINTFTFSSSLLPPTPSSTAESSYKGLPFTLLVRFPLTKGQSGNLITFRTIAKPAVWQLKLLSDKIISLDDIYETMH